MKSTPELEEIRAILNSLGFTLEENQPHIEGERYLMMKDKFVLSAQDMAGKRVIVKVAHELGGKEEIARERHIRNLLDSIAFSNDSILFPKELYFGERDGHTIWITEFIQQDKVFVAHSLQEQFFLILRAFEEQEAFHATTFEHLKKIAGVFDTYYGQEYFAEFKRFQEVIAKSVGDTSLDKTMSEAYQELLSHKKTIDAFSNYLTHTDFVPHNFRVRNRTIYMLDLSAIHFGNKYEGWARFLNYMVIHNPSLEKLLLQYLNSNRGKEDCESLRLMRIFKIGFLLEYYARSLEKTSGDLRELTLERIGFWHEILKYILTNQDIPGDFVEDYKKRRDLLRSEEEKRRQREFAIA